jgi:small subunit ribosomal protein S2
MPSSITMKALLETGVHFGHRTQKWNPKMAPYIFTERNGIHIIDLQQTLAYLNQYHNMIVDMVSNGGTVLFVGTKRQAQDTVAKEAGRCGMPYVTHRWLGGTLTNWRTIHERIETLKKLEARREKGELDLLTKKEGLMVQRKIEKLQLRLGGIRDMKSLPELVIAVDSRREATAVKEANILKIPVLAFLDTNSNPDVIDHIIPANDDAMRSIKLLVSAMADAVLEGKNMRKQDDFAEMIPDEIDLADYTDSDDEDDERYLGESTLAKLRDATLFAEEEKTEEGSSEAEAAPATSEAEAAPAASEESAEVAAEVDTDEKTDESNE